RRPSQLPEATLRAHARGRRREPLHAEAHAGDPGPGGPRAALQDHGPARGLRPGPHARVATDRSARRPGRDPGACAPRERRDGRAGREASRPLPRLRRLATDEQPRRLFDGDRPRDRHARRHRSPDLLQRQRAAARRAAVPRTLRPPIWLHPARPASLPDYPGEKRSRYDIWWALGWPYEKIYAMAL